MPTLIQIPNVEDRRPTAEKRLRVVAYCRVSTRQEEQETASSSGEILCSLSPLLPDKVPQANVIIPEILSTISNRFGSICTSHCAPSVSKENIYSVWLLQKRDTHLRVSFFVVCSLLFMPRRAGDIQQFKSELLPCVRIFLFVHRLQEHGQGPHPQRPVAVELAVDHIVLPRLRVAGHVHHQVTVPLKMAVDPVDLDLSHGLRRAGSARR